MSGKPRTKPPVLLCYEALFRSLKPRYREHPKLLSEYGKHVAGYQGEQAVDYAASISPLKNAAYYRGLRLLNGRFPFQMDTKIVTPAFQLIIEIKNMTGELAYDSLHHQFIQTVGADKKRQRNPIQQVTQQKMHLQSWLQNFNLPLMPIETLTVVSNPNAILHNIHEAPDVQNKLIHVESLPQKLQEIEKKYPQRLLTRQQQLNLDRLLNSSDKPHHPDLVSMFGLQEDHFIQGIPCEKCDHSPMERLRVKWSCPRCGHTSIDAHVRVILDYFLLRKPTISNSECRELLQLSMASTAYHLLNALDLKKTGHGRWRVYHAPPFNAFPQTDEPPSQRHNSFNHIKL
ncbi:hypothetical protein JNUCC1_01039 [Lentibacillus sp. JNUCC-1]|uniref:nuclease-related domain-containing protein n=1 Tax=Lentibacillus sp. JNUCC-1 TaxID=2654513 RepID=UPI0012E7328F|nr:nuclease-related domain-containing protein [Lentibacillus sp. JNUCC-1]MUV37233.1 hypothetical protein [Lentibacillus sp. JNUCC-1]